MIIGMFGLAKSGKDTASDYIVADHKFVPMAFADEMKRICKRVFDFSDEQLWGPSEMRNIPDKRYRRPSHTWVKLPPRERSLREEERAEFPEAAKAIEHDWYGCACCSIETEARRNEDGDAMIIDASDLGPCYLTPRYALQQLGTEWGRDCWGDTWVSVTIRDARLLIGMDKGDPTGYWYDRKLGLQSNLKTQHIPDYNPGVVVTDVRHLNEIHGIKAAGGKVIRIKRPGAGLVGGAGQHSSETEQANIPDSEFDAVILNDKTLETLHERIRLAMSMLGIPR